MALVDRAGERLSTGDLRQQRNAGCDGTGEAGTDSFRRISQVPGARKFGTNSAPAALVAVLLLSTTKFHLGKPTDFGVPLPFPVYWNQRYWEKSQSNLWRSMVSGNILIAKEL